MKIEIKHLTLYAKKKSLSTSFKPGFAQISLAAQKILVAQNFLGGAAAPPAQPPPPPARMPMDITFWMIAKHRERIFILKCRHSVNKISLLNRKSVCI